ncbi:unnamed protein product [Rotaria socialis]|uniref:Uncharacterized protein n=1 Tax=Rotaria socialis TaxID=392032 RepID=A0A818CDD4_9BILA|nr:unnamed protein product [Rotaria socialis]CAF3426487.1 unnamed protein product [Rotaria socialis]CAF3529177.1 unnamed protein product [Rotaria socialis]CAF3567217.1 unnamed protein product [Rotaria socialis]CAF3777798.1 unnamed protein product [Rotaria socialis]
MLANLNSGSTIKLRPKLPSGIETITQNNQSTNGPYSSEAGLTAAPPWVKPNISPYSKSLSDHENSWRSYFLGMPVLILGIVQIVLIVLIIILEITSLGLSTYSATGAGIWCSIAFIPTAISTVLLVKSWARSRVRASRVLIAQIILLVFTFILIGIVGSYVSSNSITNSTAYTTYYGTNKNLTTKYKVMQAQLAFSIILMFSGLAYVIFYLVVTYLALWRPFHTLDISHMFFD